jgi:hypothetical protein
VVTPPHTKRGSCRGITSSSTYLSRPFPMLRSCVDRCSKGFAYGAWHGFLSAWASFENCSVRCHSESTIQANNNDYRPADAVVLHALEIVNGVAAEVEKLAPQKLPLERHGRL